MSDKIGEGITEALKRGDLAIAVEPAPPPKPEKKPSPNPAMYTWIWFHIVHVARTHGYALGLHGSMARDLDVIAVPWTDEASDAETLVRAVMERVDGHLLGEKYPEDKRFVGADPAKKPHGRLAWAIHMEHGYIDLSVMPKIKPKRSRKK